MGKYAARFKELFHKNSKNKGKSVKGESKVILKPHPMKVQVNQLETAHQVIIMAVYAEQYVVWARSCAE